MWDVRIRPKLALTLVLEAQFEEDGLGSERHSHLLKVTALDRDWAGIQARVQGLQERLRTH